jgi:TctA family transporter
MEPDTDFRVALAVGVASALSWFTFAEEDFASPVNSLATGIITVTYAITTLIECALNSGEDRTR